MALSVTCPGCEAVYPVSEALVGKTIRCKKCGETMPVTAPGKKPAAVSSTAAKVETTRPARPRDDDEDDRPKAKSSRRREDDEDEDAPKAKPKRRPVAVQEDDEDDDRPSRRSGSAGGQKSKMPLILGGLAALVVIAGGVTAAVMLTGDSEKPAPLVAANPTGTQTPDPKPAETKPEEIKPKPVETKVEETKPKPEETKVEETKPKPQEVKPDNQYTGRGSSGRGSGLTSSMSPEAYFNGSITEFTMDMCTKASVFIKCETDAGGGTGSGWFGLAPGLVFTNAHVLDMKAPNSSEPKKLTFYLNAGTPQQREIPHSKIKILAVDRDIDLAVLQVVGEPDLPSPLKVKPSSELRLGQSVFTIGYPLGYRFTRAQGSGKEPTVSARKTTFFGHVNNDFGQLRRVKLEGGASPGNSGGAVIDAEGVVIGVVVEGFGGSAVNTNWITLLVPTEYVLGLSAGRVANLEYGIPYNDGGKVHIPVTANILNPMKKALEVRVRSWVGDANAKYRPPLMTKPTTEPSDADEQHVELKYDEKAMKATGELVYSALPPGRTYWAQSYYTNLAGIYSLPGMKVPVNGSPVDRVPVNLVVLPKEGSRRIVTMSNSWTEDVEYEGEGEGKNEKTLLKRTLKVNEQVVKGDRSDARQLARLMLQFDSFEFSIERNGAEQSIVSKKELDEFKQYFRQATAYLLMNKLGELYSYSLTINGIKDAAINFIVHFISSGALEAMQAASITLPNKMINPLETWETTKDVRFSLLQQPKRSASVLPGGTAAPAKPVNKEYKYRDQVTYTYLGTRDRGGRKEAIISVMGKSMQAPGTKETVKGSLKGIVWVEIDTGVVVFADLDKEFDMDISSDGQKKNLSVINHFKLERGPAQ